MKAWLWAGALIVLAAGVGVACGGGGGDGEATPTPDRPTLEAMLTEISLKIEDLPSGFGEPEVVFTDNEEAAASDPEGPTQALERLNGWGRLLGMDATFLGTDLFGTFQSGGDALIRASVNLFADDQGATEALQWGHDLLSNPADAATLIPGVSELDGGLMDFPTVGDETVAAQYTGTFRAEDFQINVPFTAHIVAIRHGRGVANIAVAAIGGATPGPEVEELIRILDERLGQTLD